MLDNAFGRLSHSTQRFARFLVVGALNSAVGYGLFAGLVLLGLLPEFALAVATVLGIIFNFLTTGHFVFGNLDPNRILRFLAVYGVVYLFNAAALRGLMLLAAPPLLAQLALLPAAAVLTYVALRNFVFKDSSL